MNRILYFLICLCFLPVKAQYLQNDTIYFDLANDTLARLWDSQNYNHTDIDLKHKRILNDYYAFENDTIYTIDDSLTFVIGTYHRTDLFLDRHYKLTRPVFGRLAITDTETRRKAHIRTKNDRIIFDDPNNILNDVVKLWITEKSIRRLLNREEAGSFFKEVMIEAAASF